MTGAQISPVTRDQVIARLRQNEKPTDISAALHVGVSTIYRIASQEKVGNVDHRMGKRKNTLTVPPDPIREFGKTVAIGLTDDDLAQLTKNPRTEAILVAGMVQSDSLRSRILRMIGSEGPFKNVEELANTIRRKNDNFGYHELTTIVKHLRKQGLVSLKEDKRVATGKSESHPTNIDLTLQGREQLGLTVRPITERVLELLCRDGGSSTNARLAADLWEGNSDHATVLRVDAALQVLNGQGHVSYKLGPNQTLVDIKPTENGYQVAGFPIPGKSREGSRGQHAAGTSRAGHAVGKDMTEKRHHLPWASGGPITRSMAPAEPTLRPPQASVEPVFTPEPSPVPPKGNYPLLDGLRASFAVRAKADAKASALADAAALLEKVDPEESERLMARALAESPTSLSPLEKEFLTYAEAHPDA